MSYLVRSACLTGYVELARSLSLDPFRLIAEAGLDRRFLADVELKIPVPAVRTLLDLSGRAARIENFGLRLVEARPLSCLGPLELAIRGAATLREALASVMRYLPLHDEGTVMTLEKMGDLSICKLEELGDEGSPTRQSLNMAIGEIYRLVRHLCGDTLKPAGAWFSYSVPADQTVHLGIFDRSIEFGHDLSGILLNDCDLDVPLAGADPMMAHHVQQYLEPALAQITVTLSEKAYRLVYELLPAHRCFIEQLAERLDMNQRTLARRLAREGVTFSSVVDAVRVDLARRYVSDKARPLTEVSDLLGFAALSGFSRWFQVKFGCSPSSWRTHNDDLLRSGVNIAARPEGFPEPGGVGVSRNVHDQIGTKLPLKITELDRPTLKNITQPIQTDRVGDKPTAADGGIATPLLPLPDKPSIAVLPFQNMSGDAEQEYFVDGMVEEIITALSRIRWLFVIARNSSFTYKGQAVDVKQVGHELGVRYVLEGSVRKDGNRVRIAGQLIDVETGMHLWADNFEGSLEDVFEVQDKVASSVAGVIEPALQAAETARSVRRPTADLTAYDFYLRAYAMNLLSARQSLDALRLLEQALAHDRRYGPALAWAAFCCVRLVVDGLSEDPAADRAKGADFARRALEVAADDPGVLAHAAFALARFGEDIGAMMALVDRALAQNPNFARGWYISGILRMWAGDPDIAIEYVNAALRLSPRARIGRSTYVIGCAHFVSRRFDEAVPKLLLATQEDPSFPPAYRLLAACYAHMGRLDDARKIVCRLRTISPVVMADASYLRDAEDRELFLSGLRLAASEMP